MSPLCSARTSILIFYPDRCDFLMHSIAMDWDWVGQKNRADMQNYFNKFIGEKSTHSENRIFKGWQSNLFKNQDELSVSIFNPIISVLNIVFLC